MSTPSVPRQPTQRAEGESSEMEFSGDGAVQNVLETVEDADCRTILEVTRHEPLTATEISESCSMALSTTYRKLDMLTDQGLIAERTRIRRSGKHASEYIGLVEDILISVEADGGTRVRVSRCEAPERSDPFGSRP